MIVIVRHAKFQKYVLSTKFMKEWPNYIVCQQIDLPGSFVYNGREGE
jgi:hypothetical protein